MCIGRGELGKIIPVKGNTGGKAKRPYMPSSLGYQFGILGCKPMLLKLQCANESAEMHI